MHRLGFGHTISGLLVSAAVSVAGCSPSKDTYVVNVDLPGAGGSEAQGGASGGGDGAGGASNAGSGGVESAGGASSSGGTSAGSGGASAGAGGTNVCGTESTAWALAPVDFIILADTSGSMMDEAAAIEAALNADLPVSLAASGLDYRVILLGRHRRGPRLDSGPDATAICVASPLSGLASCPAEHPALGERFFHYDDKVESYDAYDEILFNYTAPDVDSGLAPLGYSAWLRAGAKKVFVLFTDDNEDLPVDTFLSELTLLAPEHFGADSSNPTFVFHSVVGLAENADPAAPYAPEQPIVSAVCTGNGNTVASAGPIHQELSRRTGGLRFPICQYQGYAGMFDDIVVNTLGHARTCDAAIPAPADESSELIVYLDSQNGRVEFARAPSALDCGPHMFFVEAGRIQLCPETCELALLEPLAGLSTAIGCN